MHEEPPVGGEPPPGGSYLAQRSVSSLMIEFIIIALAMHACGMAKRKGSSRRRMTGYLRGNVDERLALLTLGAMTLLSVVFDETVVEKTFVTSLVANWSLSDFTVVANDGPVMVGVAHSDYTDAEIEEFIENAGSWNAGDNVQSKEVGRRLVRVVGTFGLTGEAASSSVLNDGKAIKIKLNWMLMTGQTLRVWAYNLGNSPLTTGAIVHTQGHANLFTR